MQPYTVARRPYAVAGGHTRPYAVARRRAPAQDLCRGPRVHLFTCSAVPGAQPFGVQYSVSLPAPCSTLFQEPGNSTTA